MRPAFRHYLVQTWGRRSVLAGPAWRTSSDTRARRDTRREIRHASPAYR
jgi:hypothetical protein